MIRSTPLGRKGGGLKRGQGLKRTAAPKRKPISPATPYQRKKVKLIGVCIVCGRDGVEATIDPAHLVDRSVGGCDSVDCVTALCRSCHRAYDDGKLDLLPYLAGRQREVAHAVEHLGLIGALQRLTNVRWRPVNDERRAA